MSAFSTSRRRIVAVDAEEIMALARDERRKTAGLVAAARRLDL
jgi:hypothetical protein